SSGNNSALSLALGYNGLSRITLAIAEHVPALRVLGTSIDLQVAPIMAPGIGNPGLVRLLAPTLAGQVSWLLVFALVGWCAGGVWLIRERRVLGAAGRVSNAARAPWQGVLDDVASTSRDAERPGVVEEGAAPTGGLRQRGVLDPVGPPPSAPRRQAVAL